MNKTCARCEKTVYPIEELKCLDKIWHKQCFKCQECSMTLNMKTYKGYGKLPYCEAHIPKVKPTTMAETPELKRIAENTKIQSNVKYHADFEKSKGKFTQVADDPETLRIKANSKIISNVAYHGDLEKKAAMERQRTINDNGEVVEVTDNYHIQLENYAAEMLPPTIPPPAVPSNQSQHNYPPSQSNNQKQPPQQNYASNANSESQYARQQTQRQAERQTEYSNNYNANVTPAYQNPPAHYTQNNLPNVHISSYVSNTREPNSIYDDYKPEPDYNNPRNSAQMQAIQSYGADSYYEARGGNAQQQRIGRIADYDPISDGPRNSPLMPKHSATIVYSSGPPHQMVQSHQNMQHHHNLPPNAQQTHQSAQQSHQNAQQSHQNMQQAHQNVQQQSHQGHQNAQQSHQNMLQAHQNSQQSQQSLQQAHQSAQQQAHQNMQHAHQGMQAQQSHQGHQNLQNHQGLQQAQQKMHQHNQNMQQMHHQANNGRIGGHQVQAPPGSRRIGSVADMDPLNDVYGSSVPQSPSHHSQQPGKNNAAAGISGRVYIAMYDYEATDTDEVSFREGDLITNVSSIDEGWMTGRVERTGHTGMLPANYVELAQI